MIAKAPWLGDDKTRTYALNGARNVASPLPTSRSDCNIYCTPSPHPGPVLFPLRSVSSLVSPLVSFPQSRVSLYQRISPPTYLYVPSYLHRP